MNWAHLLESLLFAATVLPVVLLAFGLLSATRARVIFAGVCTASTVYAFVRGEAGWVAWYASLTVFMLLVLRRERARKNTTKSAATKSRV